MKSTIIHYFVQWTDPEFIVDGAVKTRFAYSEQEARELAERVMRPDIKDLKITKQTTTIVREVIK